MIQFPPKRNTKDSVFVHLFQDKKYLIDLYKTLHPEDQEITEDQIKNITLNAVFVNGLYNDLGFLAKDKSIILVESQSTWSENILLRIFIYAASTYFNYFNENGSDLYGTKNVPMPRPELYMVYTGDKKNVPEKLTLSTSFFGGEEAGIEIRLNVLSKPDASNIIGQYIRFCKVFDEQRKKYGYTPEAIQNTIRICKDENVLKEFLESKESEVRDIMMNLWDQERALEIHIQAQSREIAEKARQEERKATQKMIQKKEREVKKARQEERKRNLQSCQLLLQAGKITLQDIPVFYPDFTVEEIESLKSLEN